MPEKSIELKKLTLNKVIVGLTIFGIVYAFYLNAKADGFLLSWDSQATNRPISFNTLLYSTNLITWTKLAVFKSTRDPAEYYFNDTNLTQTIYFRFSCSWTN